MDHPSQSDGPAERRNWAEPASLRWLSGVLKRLIRDSRAQDQVEYAVCIGTIALVAALSIPAIADSISTVLLNTQAALSGNPVAGSNGAPNSNNGNGNNGNCANPTRGSFQGRSPCAP
jgi:Flp pilus assembly pilin Flp